MRPAWATHFKKEKKLQENTTKQVKELNKTIQDLKIERSQAVVAHTFNPSIWEAETGRFLSLRPA